MPKSALKKLIATFRRHDSVDISTDGIDGRNELAAAIDDEAIRKSRAENPRSLEHLRSLCNVISKNNIVTEQNKTLIVETLRSTAEILIWGDQNDSTVFDFFLEKNMLSFFLDIMKQRCGSYVCVQLLQTLNILFENIRNETSLYYLLSNNHVNSIIIHKFDFTDEEVMAYYISFLKTLSFKLNPYTIHFFFSTNEFPLYTEAIKFFSHSEKMVRIAVRTLTLNVFRVDEKSMLKFITDRTAAPFFSNLIWIIRDHVINIDKCLKSAPLDNQQMIKLDDLYAEHLDHLHYLSDILMLKIEDLNRILIDHLMQRLLIPLVESYEDDPNSSMLKLFTLEFATNSVNHADTKTIQGDLTTAITDVDCSGSPRSSPPDLAPTSLTHDVPNDATSTQEQQQQRQETLLAPPVPQPLMSEQHISIVEQLKDKAECNLRELFRTSDHRSMIELFEHEYQDVRRRRLDTEYLYIDSRLLLDYSVSKPVLDLTRSITTEFQHQSRGIGKLASSSSMSVSALSHQPSPAKDSSPSISQTTSPTHRNTTKQSVHLSSPSKNTRHHRQSHHQPAAAPLPLSKCQTPLDDNERKRHCIRVYLLWRQLLHNLRREDDKEVAIDEAVFNVRLAFCASTLQSLMHQYVKANARAKQRHKWRESQHQSHQLDSSVDHCCAAAAAAAADSCDDHHQRQAQEQQQQQQTSHCQPQQPVAQKQRRLSHQQSKGDEIQLEHIPTNANE